MASLREIASKRVEMFMIDPRVIKIEPGYNQRVDTPELRAANVQLRNLIRENGFQADKPVVVRMEGEDCILVAGHRRLSQTLALINEENWACDAIAAVQEPKGRTVEERDADLLNSNSGEPLSMLDKGLIYKRMVNRGTSHKRVAELSGISEKQVRNLIDLTAAPEEIKEMIAEGTVSATLALRTVQAEGGPKATEILTQQIEDAKAQGKDKVTAGTIKKSSPTPTIVPAKGQSFLDAMLVDMGLPVEAPTATVVDIAGPVTRNGYTRPRMTAARFAEFWEILVEIATSDTDELVQRTMAKDALGKAA